LSAGGQVQVGREGNLQMAGCRQDIGT
jgi:hypothetical protein